MSHKHNHYDHDYVEANRSHFDEEAVKCDYNPFAIKLADCLGPLVLDAYPFDEEKTTVLDYACATGLMSRQLISSVKSIVGVDVSQGMVDQYNLRVFNQGIPPEEMKAVCVELKGEEGELNGQKFDVIICSLAYHHFPDINKTTMILANLLNPGGLLIVADFKHKPGLVDERHHDFVPHHDGMGEEAMRAAFRGAGLEDFRLRDVTTVRMHGKEVTIFLATGVKTMYM